MHLYSRIPVPGNMLTSGTAEILVLNLDWSFRGSTLERARKKLHKFQRCWYWYRAVNSNKQVSLPLFHPQILIPILYTILHHGVAFSFPSTTHHHNNHQPLSYTVANDFMMLAPRKTLWSTPATPVLQLLKNGSH